MCIHDVGMTKVEEKLKAGRVKRPDGCGFSEEPQRRPTGTPSHPSKKDPTTTSSGKCLHHYAYGLINNPQGFSQALFHHYSLAFVDTSIG